MADQRCSPSVLTAALWADRQAGWNSSIFFRPLGVIDSSTRPPRPPPTACAKPSRCNGRRFRTRVVRSIPSRSLNSAMLQLSLAFNARKIDPCVVRMPCRRISASKNWVTTRVTQRKLKQMQFSIADRSSSLGMVCICTTGAKLSSGRAGDSGGSRVNALRLRPEIRDTNPGTLPPIRHLSTRVRPCSSKCTPPCGVTPRNLPLSYYDGTTDGSGVLKNKLGLRVQSDLDQAEITILSLRLQSIPSIDLRSYDGFKALHAHLFGVLYEWAGEERQYTTGRSGAPFAKPEFIQGWMRRQFDNLVRIPSQGLCGHYCTNTR
jgi:hypothetical protein